jgi:hypothetical protein
MFLDFKWVSRDLARSLVWLGCFHEPLIIISGKYKRVLLLKHAFYHLYAIASRLIHLLIYVK